MSRSCSQSLSQNLLPPDDPYVSYSWPIEAFPFGVLPMHDTRFLSHIIFPPIVNAQPAYPPQWTENFYAPPQNNDMQSSRSRYTGEPRASARRRRHRQRTLGKYTLQRGLAAPSTARRTRGRSSYAYVANQSTPSPIRLTRKPRNWRTAYKSPSKGGFGSYLHRIGSFLPRSPSFSRFHLNPAVSYRTRQPTSLFYDLRANPMAGYGPQFISRKRSANNADLYQLATSPPTQRMHIWHSKLPWYIKVEASSPNGITILDLIIGIYEELRRPIGHHEYYNVELTSQDREMLGVAFQGRCGGDLEQISKGICRVDFLGQEVAFVGLAPCRNGTWEMKAAALERPRMIIVSSLCSYCFGV